MCRRWVNLPLEDMIVLCERGSESGTLAPQALVLGRGAVVPVSVGMRIRAKTITSQTGTLVCHPDVSVRNAVMVPNVKAQAGELNDGVGTVVDCEWV